jgi:hypothetical protein
VDAGQAFLLKVTLHQATIICSLNLRKVTFSDDVEVQDVVMTWLRQQARDFYDIGINKLVPTSSKCIAIHSDYAEKYIKVYCKRFTSESKNKMLYKYFLTLYPYFPTNLRSNTVCLN